MSPLNQRVRVAHTPLGRGVFALRRIRRHAVVGEVLGQVIVDPDYSSSYCMDLGSNRSLEPRPPFRFLNHSCDPNCALVIWTDEPPECDRLWVQALRAIQPGEELTIDYGWTADSAIPCLCGTSACRGWVVCEEELPLVPLEPSRTAL